MLKKFTFFLSAATLLLVFATGCKKNNKSPQELILGKWNYHSYEWHMVDGGDEEHEIEDRTSTGSYLDFKNNGTVIMNFNGNTETLPYSIGDDKLLIIEGDEIELSKLTDTELTMYYKETGDDYLYEDWTHFRK